jgi:DNA (cytosine-5)-methyltransferase 1
MNLLSLFSGIGGLDLGFERAGHKTIFANDIMKVACESYASYFRKYRKTKILTVKEYNIIIDNNSILPDLPVIHGDIVDIKKFPEADLVTGGFPCQGFSMIGTRLETDPRNQLYLQFSRVVSEVNPKFFIAENVRGLLQLYQGRVFEAIKQEFRNTGKHGYNVKSKLLNAKNYGVAQYRERVIIVGVRRDLDFEYEFPEPTHGDPDFFGNMFNGQEPLRKLRDEIGRLHQPKEDEIYSGRFSPLYMSRNRRRGWDEVSFTIQANAMHVPLHPNSCEMVKKETDKFDFKPKNGKHRRLTPKECLAIQSFDRDFIKKIQGSVQQQYTQIGNAVPPRLAEAIAKQFPKKLS